MLKVLAATFMAVCAASCAQTTASISSTAAIQTVAFAAEPQLMGGSGPAFAPPAFYPFCAERPDLCASTGSVRKMEMTEARQRELRDVNLSVNRQVREVSDLERLGQEDIWGLPGNAGDCEDFAILKKKELMKRGWPASTLLLTVVTVGGEGHVVLTASTDQGDIILDNRTNALRDWTRVRYNFFARQSQKAHGKWERIVVAGA